MTKSDRELIERLAAGILQDVCELPDRNSPEDQPEMLLVRTDELHSIITERTAAAIERLSAGRGWRTEYHVIAYDTAGYGDDRSGKFDSAEKAIEYAKSLEKRFCANAYRVEIADPGRESRLLWSHSEPLPAPPSEQGERHD